MEIYRSKDRSDLFEVYLFIYGGLAILFLLAARFLPLSSIPLVCPFKAMTGFPCPTCGATRAFIHFAHLNLTEAFVMNPLISSAIILGIIISFYSLSVFFLSPIKLGIRLSKRENRAIRTGIIGVIILNWLYLIIAGI